MVTSKGVGGVEAEQVRALNLDYGRAILSGHSMTGLRCFYDFRVSETLHLDGKVASEWFPAAML